MNRRKGKHLKEKLLENDKIREKSNPLRENLGKVRKREEEKIEKATKKGKKLSHENIFRKSKKI